jgi:hypothetical protein
VIFDTLKYRESGPGREAFPEVPERRAGSPTSRAIPRKRLRRIQEVDPLADGRLDDGRLKGRPETEDGESPREDETQESQDVSSGGNSGETSQPARGASP